MECCRVGERHLVAANVGVKFILNLVLFGPIRAEARPVAAIGFLDVV
jgi:hypothetical protein